MNTQSEAIPNRLHPLTIALRIVKSVPALIAALLSIVAGLGSAGQSLMQSPLFIFGALYVFVAFPLIVAQYFKFSYQITPKEIVILSGVFRRNKRNIPLERVQNVEITRTFLSRLMGLSTVKIMTAGSDTAEGVLEYTNHEVALEIRNTVRLQSQTKTIDSVTEPEPASYEGKLLIHMPLRRILLAGAFRFSLIYLSFISYIFYNIQMIPGISFTEQDMLNLIDIDRSEASQIADAAERLIWVVVPAVVIVASLLTWLIGIAVTAIRFYNFRLGLLDNKLIRKYGLFTLQEATIPLKRIQALAVRSNPLMRVFNWFKLELQTIGQTATRGGRMAIPLARREELTDVGAHIKPFELPEHYEKVSPITIRRTFIRYTLVLTVLIAPLSYFFWNWLWWGYTILPLLGYLAFLQYRNHGYSFSEGMLYVKRGVFRQYIWIIPAERFQAFRVNGTFFQRRLGLRTVSVDTAGAGYLRFPRIVDLPKPIAYEFTDQLYDALGQSMGAPSVSTS